MKKYHFGHLIILLTLGTILSCSTAEDQDSNLNETLKPASVKELAEANQTFGWNLLNAELEIKDGENVIISPLSVQIALYMAINGAKGLTKIEMLQALQCKDCNITSINEKAKLLTDLLSKESGHPSLTLSNGFFYDDQRLQILNPSFKNSLVDYNCVFEKSDFSNVPASLKLINDWVSNNTNSKIDKILENIKNEDIAFLINAVHYKADWATGFHEDWTRDDDFYTSGSVVKKVSFLSDDRSIPFYIDNKIKVIDIPFRDSTYSLTLIHLEDSTGGLNPTSYQELISKLKYQRAIINFPKLKVIYENDLIRSLQYLGINKAFDPFTADFSLLGTASNRIFINQLKHKVVLEADEKGVEGAAVTSIGFGVTSAPPYLKFDKPFFIVLRHISSNTMIFAGKINDPSL